MATFPFSDLLTTLKDGAKRALQVEQQNTLGRQIYKAETTKNIQSTAGDIVYENLNPCVIDTLDWACDTYLTTGGVFIEVLSLKEDGVTWEVVSKILNGKGTALLNAYPANISAYGSSVWAIYAYDTVDAEYKFGLKQPLYFPRGVRIAFRIDSAYKNVGYQLQGRELR